MALVPAFEQDSVWFGRGGFLLWFGPGMPFFKSHIGLTWVWMVEKKAVWH